MSTAARLRSALGTPRRLLAVLGVLIAVGGVTIGVVREGSASPEPVLIETEQAELTFSRLADPARTIVRDADTGALLAQLTDGSRTALLTGPVRTFAEPKFTDATVTTNKWVRLLPEPWNPRDRHASWFRSWLDRVSQSDKPDVLAVAFQYVYGADKRTNDNGVPYRGDAGFGPWSRKHPGYRQEGSDFYDYLGIPWTFPNGNRETPDPEQYRDLDCSGFIRLVYGYRMGIPLRNTNTPGRGLPRRAFAIAKYGPGTVIIENRHRPATDYERLQPGDLVFFNNDADGLIDHSGIYLGVDSGGHYRFISSRATANGPTMGDLGGLALLDGGGYYSRAFRTARRL